MSALWPWDDLLHLHIGRVDSAPNVRPAFAILQRVVAAIAGAGVGPATRISVTTLVRPFTPALIGPFTPAHIRWYATPHVRWFATPHIRPLASSIIPTLILIIVPAFFEVATGGVVRSRRRPIVRLPEIGLHDGSANDGAIRRRDAGLLRAQTICKADTACEQARGDNGITHVEAPLPSTMGQQAKRRQPVAS